MTDEQAKKLAEAVEAAARRAQFREQLDRKPPPGVRGQGTPWLSWFDADGNYLGNRSGPIDPEDT